MDVLKLFTIYLFLHIFLDRNVWKLYCPLLCSMKPGTDLCDQCQKFMLQLMRSANRPEAEKKEDMIKQEKHLAKATGQRGFLKEKVLVV